MSVKQNRSLTRNKPLALLINMVEDFFEALADVKKNYEVDDNRILVRGFSMGGASAWHIGAHYGSEFAANAVAQNRVER